MLEFVNDNKKVRLWYQFNSNILGGEYEKYECYDYDEFHFDLDIDEVKETICYELSKVIEHEHSALIIMDALNELDSWECVDWGKIIQNCEELLIECYETQAMEYFVDMKEM